MTDPCAVHRQYLGALADGQLELVPPESHRHVVECPSCGEEVLAHRWINARLSAGLTTDGHGRATPRRGRPRVGVLRVVAASLAVVGLVAGGLVWETAHRSDLVVAAVAAARAGPTMRSGDSQEIANWCTIQTSRRPPVIQLALMTPSGARMDAEGGTTVVTVFYSAANGRHVTVGWLDDHRSGPMGTRAEARAVDGQSVVVAQAPAGMAVITGDAPLTLLWDVVGTLEGAAA